MNSAAFTVTVFSSGTSDYELQNSVILDSEASLHVCNNRSRFKTFKPTIEESFVYAGNTMIPIKGFSYVTVTIQDPKGSREIELRDTAYILSFHTSVASLEKFVSKKVH
jgi:hypothetical protein